MFSNSIVRSSSRFTLSSFSFLFIAAALVATSCGAPAGGDPAAGVGFESAAVVTTCTAQNIAGYPYSGVVCGGSVQDTCSPGLLYNCTGGARGATNNCTLSTNCSVGCLTGVNSTPVTVNTSAPAASDACFIGAAPLSFSQSTVSGGSYVTITATLAATHGTAIVNFDGTNTVVPPLCNVPLELASNASSVSWVESTGVVSSTTVVPLHLLISYGDGSGVTRNLVSVPTPLTLQPGGTAPTPSLTSFAIEDGLGNPISTLTGGTNAFTSGTLSAPAPVGGVTVAVSSNPAGAFTANGSFSIPANCTASSTSGTLTATSSLTTNLAATVSATTGNGAALSQNVTVTPPALAIQSITLQPATVTGGNTVGATVNLNRAVLSGDPAAAVSIRVSEGLVSGQQLATFAGCTGSPACTGTVTVAPGASSASVTLSTIAPPSQDELTVAASATWSNHSASAQLIVNTGACTPTTSCTAQGRNCGTLFDGCNNVACGTCANGQTCGANGVCGGGTVPLTVSAQGRSSQSIVSSPAGINVAVPNQQTTSFTAGTSVTLSNPNGRNVVWSGACSSGGKGQKSCTFTINANASVTANIQ